jgi:hypothetical protein
MLIKIIHTKFGNGLPGESLEEHENSVNKFTQSGIIVIDIETTITHVKDHGWYVTSIITYDKR